MWVYDVQIDGMAQTFHGDLTRFDDGWLVASDPDEGHIYSFTEKTGDVRWMWPAGSGVSSDLFVHEGRVFAVTNANELVALDAKNGQELWRTESAAGEREIPVTSTPVVWGGDLIFARADGRLSRHATEDGTAKWIIEMGAGASTDLLAAGDQMICGLSDGRMIRFDPEFGEILGEIYLESTPSYRWFLLNDDCVVGLTGVAGSGRRLVSLDAATLAERWILAPPEDEEWTMAQPAIAWGQILVGTGKPALYGVDPQTGAISWRAPTDHPPRTARVVDSDIYIGSFNGSLDAYRRVE